MKLPGHGRFSYSPIISRPDFTWPGGKRLAVYIALVEEHFAFGRPSGQLIAEANPQPDQRAYSWHDYGNRVGFWRMMDILDELGAPACHTINTAVIDYAPQMVDAMVARGDEIVGHGRTNSERHGQLFEADERSRLEEIRDAIIAYTGTAPKGYVGPGLSESLVTPDLLQETGYKYTMEWPFDDQPTWMKTRSGRLMAVPYSLDLQDGIQVLQHHHTGATFADMLIDAFEEFLRQSEKYSSVWSIPLHPMTMGQIHRIGHLRRALTHIFKHPQADRVWFTRPGEIYDYSAALPAGIVPE